MKNTTIRNIQSVQRAINILNCFQDDTPQLSLKEISEMLELNINTTRGIVYTLLNNGLLYQDEHTNTFSLGNFFLEKSSLVKNRNEQFILTAKPYIQKISEQFNISCYLQAISNGEIYSIYGAHSTACKYSLAAAQYHALPPYATSSGKLLIYYKYFLRGKDLDCFVGQDSYTPTTIQTMNDLVKNMEQIKENGYAMELGEYDPNVTSVAFPICDSNSRLLYTISVTAFSGYFDTIKSSLIQELKNCTSQIIDELQQ